MNDVVVNLMDECRRLKKIEAAKSVSQIEAKNAGVKILEANRNWGITFLPD